ncbi:MAG: hypothetical protein PHX62_06255 [Bacilli bacterium]|nr:hypothetical protein [Bacilli bacterium]
MKFIYVLEKEVRDIFITKGFKQIGETIINGNIAYIFQNSKEIMLDKAEKYGQVLFSNRLTF